jgi:hypothetical protein
LQLLASRKPGVAEHVEHDVVAVAFAHDPDPLQKPVFPQIGAGSHSPSGSLSAATDPHAPSTPLPFFAALHAEHTPLHGWSQHTPSTQLPDRHSVASPHTMPSWRFSITLMPVDELAEVLELDDDDELLELDDDDELLELDDELLELDDDDELLELDDDDDDELLELAAPPVPPAPRLCGPSAGDSSPRRRSSPTLHAAASNAAAPSNPNRRIHALSIVAPPLVRAVPDPVRILHDASRESARCSSRKALCNGARLVKYRGSP